MLCLELFWNTCVSSFFASKECQNKGLMAKRSGKGLKMGKIYVIHENKAWVKPLQEAFHERGLPFEEWFLDEGVIDLSSVPPHGVFYNRMSASSHSRGHRYGPEYTGAVLAWLGRHGRRVINDGRALQLEISKVAQYAALSTHGIQTPKTVAAIGRDAIVDAARRLKTPFITKHNRAGKGLGVRLFREMAALAQYVSGDEFDPPVDGITLIQEYIEAPEPFITRVEFVGGRLLYAVRVDASQGFELCPADACRVDDAFCPAEGGSEPKLDDSPMFQVIEGFGTRAGDEFVFPLVGRYKRVLASHGIQIAGIEFILNAQGVPFTYDINTNTNYNREAEATAGRYGMREIATYLGDELAALRTSTAAGGQN